MLDRYMSGYPCKIRLPVKKDNEIYYVVVLGRIIGEDDSYSSCEMTTMSENRVATEKVYSVYFFSTPHGTTTEAGICHFNSINMEEFEKLTELENSVKTDFYADKLTREEINYANKVFFADRGL
jgi:hypothetical protein